MISFCCWLLGIHLTIGVYIELSLTVPITNSTAFLFTVLGEWYVEGKVISKGELTVMHSVAVWHF